MLLLITSTHSFAYVCFLLQPNHKGKFLQEYVCDQLEIPERDYFALRFVDNTKQRVSFEISSLSRPQ